MQIIPSEQHAAITQSTIIKSVMPSNPTWVDVDTNLRYFSNSFKLPIFLYLFLEICQIHKIIYTAMHEYAKQNWMKQQHLDLNSVVQILYAISDWYSRTQILLNTAKRFQICNLNILELRCEWFLVWRKYLVESHLLII